jgi:hypothetical protein
MRVSNVINQSLRGPGVADSGRARWLLWSLVTGGALAAGCGAADDPDGPEPAECDVYRIDGVRIPDEGDSRAAAILGSVFRTYDEHDLAGTWQAHLDDRLATDLVWTIETGGCDAPAEVPLGALADVGGLGGEGADGWHPAAAVNLRVWPQEDQLDARLDGELAAGYVEVIADAFLPFLNQLYAAGDTSWGGAIDTSGDGVIDRDELLADTLFQTLTRPDRGDRLSFGFDLHATWVGTMP